jgi:Family of unknown function (DUF6076)
MNDQMPELLPVVGFTWQKPAKRDGYELGKETVMASATKGGRHSTKDVVVRVLREKTGADMAAYDPLGEETGLFRMFADLDPIPEAFLAFANRYGLLFSEAFCWHSDRSRGGVDRIDIPHPRSLIDQKGKMPRWDRLQDWRIVHFHMQHFLGMFDAIRDSDQERLAGFVRLDQDPPLPRLPDVLDREKVPGCLAEFATELTVSSAMHVPVTAVPEKSFRVYMGRESSDRQRRTTLALLLCASAVRCVLRKRLRYEIAWNKPQARCESQLQPVDLVGAMYYQFSTALTEGRQFQRCPTCKRWFVLMPGVNRANKLTCSQSCRTRACRQRQEWASELKAQGMTTRAIAKELGSDVATVKRWLANGK